MTWLTLGLFAKRAGTGVITWLTHASFWQLVAIGLAVSYCRATLYTRHDPPRAGLMA
jgi:hypothetical protein